MMRDKSLIKNSYSLQPIKFCHWKTNWKILKRTFDNNLPFMIKKNIKLNNCWLILIFSLYTTVLMNNTLLGFMLHADLLHFHTCFLANQNLRNVTEDWAASLSIVLAQVNFDIVHCFMKDFYKELTWQKILLYPVTIICYCSDAKHIAEHQMLDKNDR